MSYAPGSFLKFCMQVHFQYILVVGAFLASFGGVESTLESRLLGEALSPSLPRIDAFVRGFVNR